MTSSTTNTTANDNKTDVRTEKIHILFASQTGNSEQAAREMCAQMTTKLSPAVIQKLGVATSTSTAAATNEEEEEGKNTIVQVEPVVMQLDDFLELEQCQWTRLTVIITSSYGVGQAPLGGWRFRDLCDAWYETYVVTDEKQDPKPEKVLNGLSFALCGLGHSMYTTYFQNPTRLDEALRAAGAMRVGTLGQADAAGKGDNVQAAVIARWMEEVWPALAKVVAQPPPNADHMLAATQATVTLCRKIIPDYPVDEDNNNKSNGFLKGNWMVALLVALLAVIVYSVTMQK